MQVLYEKLVEVSEVQEAQRGGRTKAACWCSSEERHEGARRFEQAAHARVPRALPACAPSLLFLMKVIRRRATASCAGPWARGWVSAREPVGARTGSSAPLWRFCSVPLQPRPIQLLNNFIFFAVLCCAKMMPAGRLLRPKHGDSATTYTHTHRVPRPPRPPWQQLNHPARTTTPECREHPPTQLLLACAAANGAKFGSQVSVQAALEEGGS